MYNEYYIKAKNLATQVLNDCNMTTLPINLAKIADHYNIILIPYSISEYIKTYSFLNITEGFSFCRNGQHIIYFNDSINKSKMRFTVAHEIGHCLLGHISQRKKFSQYHEIAANIFATNILFPTIVF